MSITTERAQELLAKYEELKVTILEIDRKYSLNYQEPKLELPPTLDLQPLQYVAKTEQQLMELAQAYVNPAHQTKLRIFEQGYLRSKQTLDAKKLNLSESLRKKLVDLLDKYNVNVANLRRKLINNGLIFSSVVTTKNQQALDDYNNQVAETNTHFDNLQTQVDEQLADLEERHTAGAEALQTELQANVAKRYRELCDKEQKEEERIVKYNQSLDEKETKYQASCQKALEYARQAEYDRALKASQLYAELGESGVESQKISEKYHYCKQYFANWRREEAVLVMESDSFLSAHLGNYYTSLVDWANTYLPV